MTFAQEGSDFLFRVRFCIPLEQIVNTIESDFTSSENWRNLSILIGKFMNEFKSYHSEEILEQCSSVPHHIFRWNDTFGSMVTIVIDGVKTEFTQEQIKKNVKGLRCV